MTEIEVREEIEEDVPPSKLHEKLSIIEASGGTHEVSLQINGNYTITATYSIS